MQSCSDLQQMKNYKHKPTTATKSIMVIFLIFLDQKRNLVKNLTIINSVTAALIKLVYKLVLI